MNDNMITAPQFTLAACVLQVSIQNFTDCFYVYSQIGPYLSL